MSFFENKDLNPIEIVDLAIKQYNDELQVNYLNKTKFIKPEATYENLEVINKVIIKCLTNKSPFTDKIASQYIDSNNLANLDKIDCYKLLLCSQNISYMWKIPYVILYKYYYTSSKENKKLNVDLFIGSIRKLWDEEDDKQFEDFENQIINEYKNIKLDIVV